MPVPSPTGVSIGGGGLGFGSGLGDAGGAPGSDIAVEAAEVGELASPGGADGGVCSAFGVGEAIAAGVEITTLRSVVAGDPPPA